MQSLDTAQLIALAGALGWASGVRLYLVVLLTGFAGFMGWVELPLGLRLNRDPRRSKSADRCRMSMTLTMFRHAMPTRARADRSPRCRAHRVTA